MKILTATLFISFVTGCAGQRDAARMLEHVQSSYISGLEPIFDKKHEKIIQAMAEERVEYLVQNTIFSGSNEGLKEDVARKYFSKVVQNLTSISRKYTEYRGPMPSKSERGELGYTYFMRAERRECSIRFEVSYLEPVSEDKEPLLLDLHITSRSRSCPSTSKAA